MAHSILHNGIHGLTPKHGCSPEDVILISFSLQPSWGSVNSIPAQVYTVVNSMLPTASRSSSPKWGAVPIKEQKTKAAERF